MLDERPAVAKADGQRAQMHVVEHLLGFLEAAHLERDNAAESRHFADGHGVIGMVLQTGIEHFLHILGAGKGVHHFLRVCADGVHAHLSVLRPRRIKNASCGPSIAPVMSLSLTMRIWSMISLRAAEKPATTSPWPLRYLVALCTTTSAPSFSGCTSSGVEKVLSTMTRQSGFCVCA